MISLMNTSVLSGIGCFVHCSSSGLFIMYVVCVLLSWVVHLVYTSLLLRISFFSALLVFISLVLACTDAWYLC